MEIIKGADAMDIYERLQKAFDSTNEGSLLDRKLVRKKEILLEDLHQTLRDALLISGQITEHDLEAHFRSRLRLSGEIKFEDIEKEAQKVFARNGMIDYEHLTVALQNRFKFTNITEQQLSPGLLDKINSTYHKENILIDCGDFDDLEPNEVIDGGDW